MSKCWSHAALVLPWLFLGLYAAPALPMAYRDAWNRVACDYFQ